MVNIWFWRKYENRPLYFFGSLGLLFTILGISLWCFLFVGRLLQWFTLSDKIWPIVALFLSLFGAQLFSWGIMMNIIIKQRYEIGNKNPYLIKKVVVKK